MNGADLSFNRITRIQGLDHLAKLTDLTLYSNRIETVENLEQLHRLEVLSLGANNISGLKTVRLTDQNWLRI